MWQFPVGGPASERLRDPDTPQLPDGGCAEWELASAALEHSDGRPFAIQTYCGVTDPSDPEETALMSGVRFLIAQADGEARWWINVPDRLGQAERIDCPMKEGGAAATWSASGTTPRIDPHDPSRWR